MTKRILFLIVFLLSCSLAWSADQCLRADCVGCWTFQEGSGNTEDLSQNNNIGTFKAVGEPAWASMVGTNAPAYSDYMTDYDGSDDYVQFGQPNIYDGLITATWTIWFYLDAFNERTIVSQWGNSSAEQVFLYQTIGTEEIRVVWEEGGFIISDSSDASLNTGEWYHLAVTFLYSGGNNSWDVYLNGSTLTMSGDATEIGDLENPSSEFYSMGAIIDTGSAPNDGKMGEHAGFDTVLDNTTINAIKNFGLQPTAAARRIFMTQ